MFMLTGLKETTSRWSLEPWGVELTLPEHLASVPAHSQQEGSLFSFLGNVHSSQPKMFTSVQVFVHIYTISKGLRLNATSLEPPLVAKDYCKVCKEVKSG